MGTCGEPNAQDGSCIPVADYGALAHNLTGAQIAATWDSTQTEFDGAYTLSKPGTDAYGNAVLTTTGAASNETQVDSSNGAETRGWTQTYGIVSAAIYLPSCGGHICSFPAFWWSSPDSRDAPAGDANVWPKGGEFDIFESTGTGGQSHYHADRGGNRVSSVAGTATPLAVPGWHIFTGVWEKDYVAVYFDGVQVMEYSSKAVAGNVPLELILDNSSGVAGPASADYVGWVQDYAWSGGSPD
jgi:beta-glucanase (GH16 family)